MKIIIDKDYSQFLAQNIQWVTESVRKVRDNDRLTP